MTGSAGNRSWSLLTMHKAASAFVGSVLTRAFQINGVEPIDPLTDAFRAGLAPDPFIERVLVDVDCHRRFYGPFRLDTLDAIARSRSVRPIVHVRDVRDCIVSMYFSLAYSHEAPGEGPEKEKFDEGRRYLLAVGIERYVEEVMARDEQFARLGVLSAVCKARGDVVLSRYETMVSDFPGWLDGLAAEIGLALTRQQREAFLREAAFGGREDVFSHRRQVVPGDFRRKLPASLQDRLTEFYRDDLAYFGYL
jgi:hypothetical protein